MIDDLAVVRAYLVAQVAVTSITGTRVWARRRTPKSGWKPSDGGCIVFARRGGTGDKDQLGHVFSTSFQFKCYGGGADVATQERNAAQLYRVVRDALNVGGNESILGMQAEGQAIDLEETYTGWPYTLAFFRAQFRNS